LKLAPSGCVFICHGENINNAAMKMTGKLKKRRNVLEACGKSLPLQQDRSVRVQIKSLRRAVREHGANLKRCSHDGYAQNNLKTEECA